ncbi:3584_t:CDS:2 [Ambispora gerdemannii]|uniref:3584_t:CDS:1 n=1 Tax=Ambispora gerdemannii TaxID=144530 RepID=A0A9N9GH40_9GLOM|nr:3584_t:CDS:2 [Ambispora gerdemannii]
MVSIQYTLAISTFLFTLAVASPSLQSRYDESQIMRDWYGNPSGMVDTQSVKENPYFGNGLPQAQ